MSERTAPALAKLDELLPILRSLPAGRDTERILEEGDALRRAVAAFHMEAIRFRMHNVDRLLKLGDNTFPPIARQVFEELRAALEAAGFHTRSREAP
ncbi:MAG: hypothetical protein EPO35_03315 [Acidobacteria bacterium]|nr:MAG: hypothetical protein EPO35_03315 [Acidobacteriota bacterium]